MTTAAMGRFMAIGMGIALSVAALSGATLAVTDDYARAGELLDRGAFQDAIRTYEGLLRRDEQLDDTTRSRILNNLGFAHYKLRRPVEALGYYRRALEIDPDYVTCMNNVAAVLMNERRFVEALTYLERARKREANVKVVFNLFATHYYLGHRKEALAFVEEAFRLDERYTEARLRAKNIKQRDIDELKRRLK